MGLASAGIDTAGLGPANRTVHQGFRGRAGIAARGLVLIAALQTAACGYRDMQQLEEQAGVARNEIEVQLQRRAELVPSLLETVQEYGGAGDSVIARVADARVQLADAVKAGDLPKMREACAALTSALAELLEGTRRNRGLAEDPGFQVLSSQLAGTEEQIEQAGRRYNQAASEYNSYIADFPQLVTARVVGARRLELFDGLPGDAGSGQAGRDE